MILGDMVGRTTESPGSNAAGWGVAYALENRWHPAVRGHQALTQVDLANAIANNGHGQPRRDVELIAYRNPCEQVYPTTVADAGQP
jgi:hypothetical protein